MTLPLIACLCPTYKRPASLRNAIACFVAQTYPHRLLVILDDAGQHVAQASPAQGWRLISRSERYATLPAKWNALAASASSADILAVWEDDDIYLPHHLAAIAEAAVDGDRPAFFAPRRVLSTYGLPKGQTQEEGATGRFHAAWAYSRRLWDSLGGYEDGDRLDFDQRMGARCAASAGITCYDETDEIRRFGPSYAYRWGRGPYNGSQSGEGGYSTLWRQLADEPSPRVEMTGPLMDDETELIIARHGWERTNPDGPFVPRSRRESSDPEAPRPNDTVPSTPADPNASPTARRPRKPTVCLVMLIEDDGAVIERCLASVRGAIDTWLIVDAGPGGDTRRKVEAMLAGIPGEYLSRPWTDTPTHRTRLLDLARERADTTLWMAADETLAAWPHAFDPPTSASAHGVEVRTSRGSWMQPRLLRRDADVRFAAGVGETLAVMDAASPLSGAVVLRHEDGVRSRDATGRRRDCLHLESVLLDDPADCTTRLALADAYAVRGDHVAALLHYRKRAELGGDAAQTWYALYQAARMLDEHGFATPRVVEAYHAAYDHRPGKAEPLLRIARRCLQEGRNETALDIARAALDTPFDDRVFFFEPDAYHGRADLLYVRALLALGRDADVVARTEQCLSRGLDLSPGIAEELDALRVDALRSRSQVSSAAPAPAAAPVATAPPDEVSRPIFPATPARPKRKLCIGMATYDDYDGVYFSVQAIRMFHPEVADDVELLVIDNHPTGRCAEGLKGLDAWVPNYRYVPEGAMRGTATRDRIFRETEADYVLVMDCHVLIVPGALRRLLDYFESRPDCADLLQGPLVYDDLRNLSTHFDPVWRGGMYGTWATDPRGLDADAPPFDIPMQGLGVFACRRDAWPGFNPRFRGFGGEEGYLHEKFRRSGARTLCLPFLRWVHRFHRPLGIPYPANWYERVRNYSIGHRELGLDAGPIDAHFAELIGAAPTKDFRTRIDREFASPLDLFDGVYAWRGLGTAGRSRAEDDATLDRLGILDRVVGTHPAPADRADDDALALERVLAHRRIVEEAKRQRLGSALVIESTTRLEEALSAGVRDSLKSLASETWDVYTFAASDAGTSAPCAVAYHSSAYDLVLAEIPETPELAARWMADAPDELSHLRADRIMSRHLKNAATCSDINEHLDTLKRYAATSLDVTELGVRDAVSTWSLLAGKPQKVVSYDVYRSPRVEDVQTVARESGIAFEFVQKDVLDVEIDPTDLLFIDTLHTYDQLRSELRRHGNKSRKYILLHDTSTFADVGENGQRPGLQAAVDEFLDQNRHWQVAERHAHNNGLTCLVRRDAAAPIPPTG